MTRLEWFKADRSHSDPGRVVDVSREFHRAEKWVPPAERERKRREKAALQKAEKEEQERKKLLKHVQWLRARAARGEELSGFERALLRGWDKKKEPRRP